jgi:pyruvate formate lyase activating enzyme
MFEQKKSVLQKNGRCLVCERQCLIKKNREGHCGTRINRNGIIYTLNYGNISSISINPIEKKPFFHFHPGSRALTVGYWSCNFDCPWCQNYDISKAKPRAAEYISPEIFVKIATANSCQGTSLSFNEPTLFLEWGIEVFNIARRKGLYNTIVTNGYMTKQALNHFVDAGLNAANVDIKGDKKAIHKYCHIDTEKVWRNCKIIRKANIHLEITTLIIPKVNEDIKILSGIGKRILNELGDKVPWHLTRYFPAYKFSVQSTPIKFLEESYVMAKDIGLKFVYLGNISGHKYENTYCPNCNQLLLKRSGLAVVDVNIDKNLLCPKCKTDLKEYFIF